jgi:hypothetical protein
MQNERLIGVLLLGIVIAICCTGCTSNRGWQFNIGVAPVSAITYTQQLRPDTLQVRKVSTHGSRDDE